MFSGGSLWILIISILVGAGFAVWTYRNTVPRTSNGRRKVLIVLRSLGIALLLFAVFQPVFSSTTAKELTPTLALVLDNSQSMQLSSGKVMVGRDTSETRSIAMEKSVTTVFPKVLLADRDRLDAFAVGENTTPYTLKPTGMFDSLKARASVTNLSSMFGVIREARKTQNIEAIVLYSDGAFTAGASPVYAAADLGVPVYAVGLGDSSEVRDVAVSELFTNEVATVGADQPVDVTIHAAGAKPGERVTVGLYAENENLDERILTLNGGASDQSFSFHFKPATEGIVKLSVRASSIPGEITEKNNLRLQYVKVLKNKFKVALFAGAPSSDVSFIKSYFQNSPSIELQTFIQKQGAEYYSGTPTLDKLQDVDLLVLVGFPIRSTSDESINVVRDLVTRSSKPLLFVPSHDLDDTKLAALGDALPFQTQHLRASSNEIKVSPHEVGSAHDDPILRIPPQQQSEFTWESLAPLFKTETHYEARPESQMLLEATLQGVKLGEPLLLSRHVGLSRTIAFTGYGLWQWKLNTFGREQAFLAETHSHDSSKLSMASALDILLANATRWLTTRDENKHVKIEPERKFYEAGEKIEFTGEVYNESFEPVENADVTARIAGGTLQKPLVLSLEALGNGRYVASLPDGLPAGDYSYSGDATRDGKSLGYDNGRFNVGEFNIEFAEPRMRSDILRELAQRTGGKFYTPETAGSMLHDIQTSAAFTPKRIENTKEFELWNAWPLLLAAICCFGTEWFLRKRSGML